MPLTRALWEASEPALWHDAATDWRRLTAAAELKGRDRREFAASLGYATTSKPNTYARAGHALLAAADAGDAEAIGRVERAHAFGRFLELR